MCVCLCVLTWSSSPHRCCSRPSRLEDPCTQCNVLDSTADPRTLHPVRFHLKQTNKHTYTRHDGQGSCCRPSVRGEAHHPAHRSDPGRHRVSPNQQTLLYSGCWQKMILTCFTFKHGDIMSAKTWEILMFELVSNICQQVLTVREIWSEC